MRLEVTRKTDLGAQSLIVLAESGERVKAAVLASRIGTTPGFLAQVMALLVTHGWVRSDPGPVGGYSLATPLEDISVLDVVEGIEGPTDVGRCVLQDRACSSGGPCVLHSSWAAARGRLVAELAGIPMSSLVSRTGARRDLAPVGLR